MIEKSVSVDIVQKTCSARLPFIGDPEVRLQTSNEMNAIKIYKSVIRGLSNNPSCKNAVIQAEKKLQNAGFVEYLDNLTDKQRKQILNSKVHYFLPWRPTWNMNSISTTCRVIFNGSFSQRGEYSLNDLLVKGHNGMNKLVEIAIRWCVRKFGFHTDISKMYPSISLEENFWNYQLYKWHEDLSVDKDPKTKVIKTLIYGIRSSGNQAEHAIREIARLCQEEFPRAANVIYEDTYVDDFASGEHTSDKALATAREVGLILKTGGFSLKDTCHTGYDPPESVANDDGISVNVLGMKWYPKEDKISLNTSQLNFTRKKRGKKEQDQTNVIPEDFTRRQCVGKVAEVHDLLGKASPIIGGFKLDLRELTNRKLDWDDKIPNELKALWVSNFEMIRDLSNIRYNRAIVPEDAISLDIDTIDTSDASQFLACVAIYARFKRKCGNYSCQLIFSRTKLVPDGYSQPKAEIFACGLNASSGHVVALSLGDLHKECVKLTDSQVALHWICNDNRVLKIGVRNQVIEINRLTNKLSWRYVHTSNMIADIGTRKGAKLSDIDSDSLWINGFEWMKRDKSQFPVMSVEELKLDSDSLCNLKNEYIKGSSDDIIWLNILERKLQSSHHNKGVVDNLKERYKISNYVIDPNKFRFRKVVRVLAVVMLFIRKLKSCVNRSKDQSTQMLDEDITKLFLGSKYLVTEGKMHKLSKNVNIQCQPGLVVNLSESDISGALNYFFKKATAELRYFVNESAYQKISIEQDGILYYKGRILPSQKINGRKGLSDVMLDLSESTFFVPVIDSGSPVAYSIVNEIHWYDENAMHSGTETVLRYTQKISHIIHGRDLVKKFKASCNRCRVLERRALEVVMGPVKDCNVCIAPAFYSTQIDLCGPFSSYSNHNKRATVNIWLIVFCCCTTGAVSIKVMDDYSTAGFLLAFIRFSTVYGYPKFLFPDEGSQLIKGCKSMQISYIDLQHQLNIEYGVQFKTCPVGGHNMHGKVERKVRHIRESLRKKLHGNRLSFLQWETLGDQIANNINNAPIATVSVSADLENLDILTPNRLLLGRNNDRSPSGPLMMSNDYCKVLQANIDIFTIWFESWLISYVPKLMDHPKWFHSDKDIEVGDIVLFLKTDGELSRQYQYGIVSTVEKGRDDKIRSVTVTYRNSNEKKDRCTRRAVRELVVIHHVNELSIFEELAEATQSVDSACLRDK